MSGLTFQDLLRAEGIDPGSLNVILNSPHRNEGDLLEVVRALVPSRPELFEAYQAGHSPAAARTLNKRRSAASFVKVGPGSEAGTSRMLFVHLFSHGGMRVRSREEYLSDEATRWLYRNFGDAWDADPYAPDGKLPDHHFDMKRDERMAKYSGRLLVEARLTQAYVRLAENLHAPIVALHEESVFDAGPPDWRKLDVRGGLVETLPPSWVAALLQWRGIYLIVDESDGARYVGAAYGQENILGRWRAHVAGDRGVPRGLSDRDPRRFRFSILERTSPDAPAEGVRRLEQTWMNRLHTRRFGLNAGAREAPGILEGADEP
jgi:hypothetical protein